MENQDLISVVIPVYNMERYLTRCLDSVCNNTYKNLEIICVNDGSTDSSLEILRKYKEKDERIIIINQENQRLSACRNIGLDIAKGKWVAMIDSDDWVHSQYFESLLYIANKEKAQVSICGAEITSSEKKPVEELFDITAIKFRAIKKSELYKLHVVKSRVWGKLYLKEFIGNQRFILGTEPVEDKCFNTLLFTQQTKYCITERKLYNYYIREDSTVQTNTGRQSLGFAQHMIPLIARVDDPEKQQDIIMQCYNILLSSRYLEMFSKDYNKIEEEINSYLSVLKEYRKILSIKKRIIYDILCEYPTLYRTWRIINDPTLLQYEADLKDKNIE